MSLTKENIIKHTVQYLNHKADIMFIVICLFVCLFSLILYVPSTISQLNRDGSSWDEPVLS